MPDWHETNAAGVPLRGQSGQQTVHDFDQILASLPPSLRLAFEQERAAREVELHSILATDGYRT